FMFFFFFQAEDGIRDGHVTGVQTCALPIFQHEVDSSPARGCAGFWVAIEGAALVGWALAHLTWTGDPSVAHLEVVVIPDARGRRSEERRVGKECRNRGMVDRQIKR